MSLVAALVPTIVVTLVHGCERRRARVLLHSADGFAGLRRLVAPHDAGGVGAVPPQHGVLREDVLPASHLWETPRSLETRERVSVSVSLPESKLKEQVATALATRPVSQYAPPPVLADPLAEYPAQHAAPGFRQEGREEHGALGELPALLRRAEREAAADLYVYLYLSLYIYIYIYTHTYVHTYIHTYIHYITLHYITLHYTTLRYATVHYITLHYITLHYITLHYITLHYITYTHCTYI